METLIREAKRSVEAIDMLIGDAMAWSAQLGLPVTRHQSLALAALALVAVLVVVGLLLGLRGRDHRVVSDAERVSLPLAHVVRGPRRLGYGAILLCFGGLGAWGGVATLASAALAPGVVSADGGRKTVQHLEGGIVREIHVQEGDRVEAGQVLISLEDIRARAEFEELRERFVHLVTTEARLLAEQAGDEEIAPPYALEGFDPGAVEPALTAQGRLLASRRATLEGREQILGQRVLQLEAEIEGLHEVIEAQNEQLALLAQEIEGVQTLYDKGLSRLPQLLELQRRQADVRAGRASNRARIARHEQSIGETRLQLLTMREELQERIAEELSVVRTELAAVRTQLPSREDVLTRTAVKAPLAGTVMNVRVTTASGVIDPGQPLLDLVPQDLRLVVDARVKPTDVDTVRAGQSARVLFPAYRQRNMPQIFGRLRSISADRLTDERTGEPYFLARVEVEPEELADKAPEIELSPGMPTDVMILTGERTLLDYLLRPFVESVTKSFRES